MLCGISSRFQLLSPSERQVAHTLLTRPPLSQIGFWRISIQSASFDLHVLGTPPAFILSQDQTLNKSYLKPEGLKSNFWSLSSSQKNFQSHLTLFKFPFLVLICISCFLTLFNFQGTLSLVLLSLSATAWLIYHTIPLLSTLFFGFFWFFSGFFICTTYGVFSSSSPAIYRIMYRIAAFFSYCPIIIFWKAFGRKWIMSEGVREYSPVSLQARSPARPWR